MTINTPQPKGPAFFSEEGRKRFPEKIAAASRSIIKEIEIVAGHKNRAGAGLLISQDKPDRQTGKIQITISSRHDPARRERIVVDGNVIHAYDTIWAGREEIKRLMGHVLRSLVAQSNVKNVAAITQRPTPLPTAGTTGSNRYPA